MDKILNEKKSLFAVSGVLGSKENAQSQVSLGVGYYAGVTVFTLTLQWGICLIVGARKLGQKSRPDHSESPASCCLTFIEKLTELNDTGIKIDDKTRYTAGIMLLSLIPYVIVQLVDIFNTSHIVLLIALIVYVTPLTHDHMIYVPRGQPRGQKLFFDRTEAVNTEAQAIRP
ncbi:sodium/calcium exchanger family protein/calcium-binding EF hand family protein [Abeliophyllum distichum]|uniref:Sodium/calcium exchanger family protein/calcium-binding EF hand family protein n=1 Tax=Abeliophyllum distichum TaxID=126358 RepID=A0ABD1U287_9LAMI